MRSRVLRICALAVPVGAVVSLVAVLLLWLIGFFTNPFFYGRISTELVAPSSQHWAVTLFVPVAGGLVVGLMARFGSEKIRGHGLPETIEAILTRGSKVEPKVAGLKPLSSAISIGSGGPFGAEGPVIMIGGACGSVLAQFLRLTADERRTLLVSGAAAGMAATFNAPMASILLAVELLLFEWRPRSFVPVAASVATATIVRGFVLGTAPLFPVPDIGIDPSPLVYFAEDLFAKLPFHWMWWPAIGGVVIGGLVEPRALGVGYGVIHKLLLGEAALGLIVGILVIKTLIWSLSLGSGTSGGVLAPVFMIGGALGTLEGQFFPHVSPGFWALMGLAAVVGGVMRSPLTDIVLSLELTHEWSALLPVVVAATAAYLVSTLIMKRSVLTEKVARHGFHLTREYSVDPLEVLFVRGVMWRDVVTLPARPPLDEAVGTFLSVEYVQNRDYQHRQRIYPVVADDGRLQGVVTRRDMLDAARVDLGGRVVGDLVVERTVTVHPDQTLREVANEFAGRGVTRAPVVDRDDPTRLRGLVTLTQLLEGRLREQQEERVSERMLRVGPRPASRRNR